MISLAHSSQRKFSKYTQIQCIEIARDVSNISVTVVTRPGLARSTLDKVLQYVCMPLGVVHDAYNCSGNQDKFYLVIIIDYGRFFNSFYVTKFKNVYFLGIEPVAVIVV